MDDRVRKDWHNNGGVIIVTACNFPRKECLDATVYITTYVGQRYNSKLVYDPLYPEINHSIFKKCDWSEFFWYSEEAIPRNAPGHWGKKVDIHMLVDSDHAGDKVYCRSRSDFLIHINTSLVQWFSMNQSTVESTVIGTEFVAMKQGICALRSLRYKLRIMGIPISGPSCIYGDNMWVVNNTSRPESVLTEKSNSVCCHAVYESVAMRKSLVALKPSKKMLQHDLSSSQ